jgi:hypothetical protein
MHFPHMTGKVVDASEPFFTVLNGACKVMCGLVEFCRFLMPDQILLMGKSSIALGNIASIRLDARYG